MQVAGVTNNMAPHCYRHSSPRVPPASEGLSGVGYKFATTGTGTGPSASPNNGEKPLPVLTLPGSAWKLFLGGGNRCYLNQIVFLLVVVSFITSALVVLNSLGVLLAWQQRISTSFTKIPAIAATQSFGPPDILDLHKIDYEMTWAHGQPSAAPSAAVEPTRSTRLRFRKEPTIDFSVPKESWFLDQLNGTKRCKYADTTDVYVFGLDKPSAEGIISLPVDEDHDIFLVSYDANAVRRCSGGDYFEADLDGRQWKSRPPTKDLGDGGYALKLRVNKRFAGTYSFKVVLLFDRFNGLFRNPQKLASFKLVLNMTVEFYIPASENESSFQPPVTRTVEDFLPLCSTEDLQTYPWQGRWTRTKLNETCAADPAGRWRCLDPHEPCETPWCEGPVGQLESNGWAYSAHCHFRIFSQVEAWQCLSGKHLFFWGDSNHPDTTRNILNFLLGGNFSNFPRIYDTTFSNPLNQEQAVRFTVLFNGHVVKKYNNMGLSVLADENYAANIRKLMDPQSGNHIPDAFILNSGIHDGIWWKNINDYVYAAKAASNFWASLWRNTSHDESKRPKVVYRTTIAPAGQSRNMPANPQKMEVLNAIIVENMVKAFGKGKLRIVDEFDMTFPFHYDNFYSDGGHYGRIPNPQSWWPGGHMYFVDIMLAHILLNSLCPL